MWGVGKASRRPPAVRPRDRNGGFPKSFGPRLSDGVARGFRCPASPRHALLAENRGKPSLWVNIKALWYQPRRQTVQQFGTASSWAPSKRLKPILGISNPAAHCRNVERVER